jgi:hypothetical protein
MTFAGNFAGNFFHKITPLASVSILIFSDVPVYDSQVGCNSPFAAGLDFFVQSVTQPLTLPVIHS